MSMTIADAIKRINQHMSIHKIGQYPHILIAEALHMALDALREKAERDDPKPLTLEELRQMDGESVWIVWPDGRIKSQWWIVKSPDWYLMEFDDPIAEKRYGSVWIAYRHKPRDVTDINVGNK